eukprot:m.72126 g.72126  ORF g.72126 m.72126 type:complete len:335 (-) comp24429_c0_seq3:1691-2695(-)
MSADDNMLSMPRGSANKAKQALYNCSWCAKPFKYPSQLKEHIRVHTREKPYPCGYCSKAFSHSSALTQHERIHTGEKPFQCSWCDKSFSQSSNLKRHERVHATACNQPDSRRPRPPSVKVSRGITEHNGQDIEERPTKKSRSQDSAMKTESFPVKTEDRFHLSPQSSNTFQRELYPRSPKDSPSRIVMTTPRSFVGGDENYEPTPEIGGDHFVQRCRQAALNKSIENYLECGPNSMSPLIQDDVSNFLMTRLAWSPSVLLGSPRSPLRIGGKSPRGDHPHSSVVQSLNMKDDSLPSSSLSRGAMGMGIVDSPTKTFIRTNLHSDKHDRVSHFRF